MNHCVAIDVHAFNISNIWFPCIGTMYNMRECDHFRQAEWEPNGVECRWKKRGLIMTECGHPEVRNQELLNMKLEEI